jgi:hypothetical protein
LENLFLATADNDEKTKQTLPAQDGLVGISPIFRLSQLKYGCIFLHCRINYTHFSAGIQRIVGIDYYNIINEICRLNIIIVACEGGS